MHTQSDTHTHIVTICHISSQPQRRFICNADSLHAKHCMSDCVYNMTKHITQLGIRWKTFSMFQYFWIFWYRINIKKDQPYFSSFIALKVRLIHHSDCKELVTFVFNKCCCLFPFRVMMQGQLWQQPCWGLEGPNLKPGATALCPEEEGWWRRWAPCWPGGKVTSHVIVSPIISQSWHICCFWWIQDLVSYYRMWNKHSVVLIFLLNVFILSSSVVKSYSNCIL